MATPAEVIHLFADVREGSSFERARAAANAFRAFGALSAADKRDLAVLVAKRAAPHLSPKIQAETGLDLTREQAQVVIDMAGRIDADDIEELRHAVRDEEVATAPMGAVPAPPEEDEAPSDAARAGAPEPEQAECDLEPAPATVGLTTRVRAARHPLVELLHDQTTGAGCVRALRAHVAELADMDAAGRTAVVDAVPDGWARRRALQAMLEAQVLPAGDLLGPRAAPRLRGRYR